jgi:hypothetical protein
LGNDLDVPYRRTSCPDERRYIAAATAGQELCCGAQKANAFVMSQIPLRWEFFSQTIQLVICCFRLMPQM